MVVQTRYATVEEFEAFVLRPENQNRLFEYVGREIVEVVSNNYSSKIGANVLIAVGGFIREHKLGDITGADGGYEVSGERYIPDVGFISRQRQPKPSHATWNPLAPDLAIEVLSPSDKEDDVAIKVANYLAANTTVWLFRPLEQRVAVFVPGQPVRQYGIEDTLPGGEVLPGFALPLKEMFD